VFDTLYNFFNHRSTLFRSVELGHSLISRGNNDDEQHTLFAQGIIACIIAEAPQRNEHWLSLTIHQLGITEQDLQSYLDHGDSVLLATLIHFTRKLVRIPSKTFWERYCLVALLSRFRTNYNVQDTLPELQRAFCDLWNETAQRPHDEDQYLHSKILEEIFPVYLTLHQGSTQGEHNGTPLCDIPSHRIHPPSNLTEVNDGEPETVQMQMTHDPTITPALLYRDAVSPIIPPVATCDAPSSPMPKLGHTIPHPGDEPSRHGVPGMLQRSTWVSPSLHPSPLDSSRFSDSAAAGPIQGTANQSIVSSMVGPINCPHPSGDAVTQHNIQGIRLS
jgi:hypothetical protein